jgi:hypothetical protein
VGPFGVEGQGIGENFPGPHSIPDGGSIEVTFAFAVQTGDVATVNQFPADYEAYLAGGKSVSDLMDKYPALENAFAAQVAYEGVYDQPPAVLADDQNINVTDFHGRETRLRAPPGIILSAAENCETREGQLRQINEFGYTWFDFDCNYCTGIYVSSGPVGGKWLRRWNTAAPPPNPNLNVSTTYNFSDNPERRVAPSRDGAVLLAWDNLSEVTVDPEKSDFDFRSYRVWRVSGWRRPVGSAGPADEDWALLGHYRFFDHADSNKERFATFSSAQRDSLVAARSYFPSARDSIEKGLAFCPQIFVPNLSIRTVTAKKSRFATADIAAGAIQALSNQLVGKQLTFPLRVDGARGEDGATWRFEQTPGTCTPGTFRTVGLDADGDIVAEVCRNPIALEQGVRVPICLYKGDLWDRQSGHVLRPQPDHCYDRSADGSCRHDTIPCQKDDLGNCIQNRGAAVGQPTVEVLRTRYPVGRYQYQDLEVKNGFAYFYAVTAGDSVSGGIELLGRRSGVEAEAVEPQAATRTGKGVWVVPNPYRGYPEIDRRPSSWDLTPNATDPTGTHIDFMGMPPGTWNLKIFTVSGDLVAELNSGDAVNESVRAPATVANPNFNPNIPEDPVSNPRFIVVPGYNRQQDSENDGQARWNLISRNGQDVVSGIYLFVVESGQGTQRGRFVIIR